MTKPHAEIRKENVVRRQEPFADRITTKIWMERQSSDNPYQAEANYCYGYDLLELMQKKRFSEVLFLLFKGELPTLDQADLLERLQIGLINPGPRHPATRAAMNAGIGKTDSSHILPIGLIILGGDHLGAVEVEQSMRWLRKRVRQDPQELAQQLLTDMDSSAVGDIHIAPGFGSRFGSVDLTSTSIAEILLQEKGAGEVMNWTERFVAELTSADMGWLSTGLAAAIFCDLGFQPRAAPGLFQLLCAPGLFAHGIEQAPKPLTAMPFPEDTDYIIEYEKGSNK